MKLFSQSILRLTACFIVFLASCGERSSTEEPGSADPKDTSLPAVDLPPNATAGTGESELSPLPSLSGDRFDRELQSEIALVDPSSDGWDSEVIAEKILKTMKAFALWTGSGKEGPCPLAFDPSFQGARQTEEGLPLVYEGQSFRVWRGKLSQMLRETEWLANWASQGTTHFKVIQISANGEQVQATLLMDRFTETETPAQENAVWITEWKLSSDDELALKTLTTPFYERVEPASKTASTLFADATGSVLGHEPVFHKQLAYGIDHWRDRLDWRFGIDVIGPHGLALGDVNGDGLDDLYICETGGLPNRLLVQQADGTVRDMAPQAGVDFIEPTYSALFVDWDNDGDQDLALSAGRHVFFYANDGSGKFEQKAVAQSEAMARSLAAADYDLDGDVDLYVCGYFNRSGDSIGLGRPMPYHDANNGVENHLLANQGNWRFEDVTAAVGLDENNRRFSYAAVWEDADNDGDPDLYVANDFGRNNYYRNDGGRFSDVAAMAGVEDLSAGMSVSWADYDQDGLMDLYVGNMFSSAGNRVAYQREYRSSFEDATQQAFRRHARGNTLFQNRGDGTFRDVTLQAGVNMGRWAWSSNFADVNNDSYEDLLIANGMVTSIEDTGDL